MRSSLELGVVVKPHGVRGAVRIQLHNPGSTALEAIREVILEKDGVERTVRTRLLGSTGGQALVEIEGVSDREAAEALRGARLFIDRAALPPPGEDEYYCADLLGCAVEDEQGAALGTVEEVLSAGASDVLVIRLAGDERMIPLVDEWVVDVDVAARRIRVRGADQFETTKS